jgi:hypothetical protein
MGGNSDNQRKSVWNIALQPVNNDHFCQTVARYELQVVFWCKEHVILNTSIPSLLVQGACHSQYEHSFPFGARSMSFSIRTFLPFWCKEHVILNTSIPSLLVQGACHSQYEHSFPFGARSMSFSIPAFLPFWCKEYVINDYQYEHSFPMAYVKHRL